MSRPRTRPTREETRERLFEAAAAVFEDKGIAGASIEAISEAAGFSRGAFYSNFATKDELIMEMIGDHVALSLQRNLDLVAAHRDAADFVHALAEVDRSVQDPLGRSPLLHMELLLHVARSPDQREALAERLRSRRSVIVEVVRATNRASGEERFDPERTAAMLLALEDGFRLHQLIDPEGTPPDSFVATLADLQRNLGIGLR